MNIPAETELASRLHRSFRKWAGNIGCGDHDPETWNAVAETAAEYLQLKATAKVHIGTSVLSRDLVWCDCGRGLSRSGNWMFCPNCGRQIEQGSYRAACELAERNGVNVYRNVEEAEQIIHAHDALKKVHHLANLAVVALDAGNDLTRLEIAEIRRIAGQAYPKLAPEFCVNSASNAPSEPTKQTS